MKKQLQNHTARKHSPMLSLHCLKYKEPTWLAGQWNCFPVHITASTEAINDECQAVWDEEGISGNAPWNSFSFHSHCRILKIFFLRNEQRWHFSSLGLRKGSVHISTTTNSLLIWCRCHPQLYKQGWGGHPPAATDGHSASWQNSCNVSLLVAYFFFSFYDAR